MEADKMTVNQQVLAVMSALIDRKMLAGMLGKQYNGDRDMYDILGYPTMITFAQFLGKYDRQDVAGRLVDLPAIDTWRKPPIIRDGDDDTEQEEPRSKFIQALKVLIDTRRLWHYLQRVDRLAGIGQFGVLLIGARGESGLDQPLEKGALKRPEDVIYFGTFSEGSATVDSLVADPKNERFGLPEYYSITLQDGAGSTRVHWSRVVHVAEDLLEDEVYGRPRLERVYNRLNDLEKMAGGGAEATWKVMDRGLHADVRDGFTMDGQAADDLTAEIDEYVHGLRRFIRTQGVNLNPLGSEVVDPRGMFEMLMALISAATGIPVRILTGSERGELASQQDQASWAGIIAARQTQFAEPVILRALIDRLVALGALPAPKAGKYTIEWQSLFELNELERAQVANTMAEALTKAAPGGAVELMVGPDEFREKVLKWPQRQMTEEMMLDEEDAAGEADTDGSTDTNTERGQSEDADDSTANA